MKKTLSILSLLLSVSLLIGAMGAFTVHADEPVDEPEETEVTYEKKEVTAYVFAADSTTTIECVFRSDLPDVPFLCPTDYLNVIYTDEFTVAKNEDGTYTVTNAYEQTMVLDPTNDTVHFENYDGFTDCVLNEEGSSVDIDYVQAQEGEYLVEPTAVTVDLGAYGVEVYEEDGKVYLPLTVIAAMFSITYNNAVYLDGEICFVHTFDPESYYDTVDDTSRYQALTRSKAEAEFTYNTLCLFIDYFYGHPSAIEVAEMLEEKGLDKTLDEYDEYTPFIKNLLLSEDRSEYFSGISMLGYYLFDGGHTVLPNIPIIAVNNYNDQPLGAKWYSDILQDTEVANLVWAFLNELFAAYDRADDLIDVREDEYEKYVDEIVKEWESGAYLIIHGNTAVFVFDSFEEDTPDEFKDALDTAKEAGVVNFILDDSCNGGGYVAACLYICTLISNAQNRTNVIKTTDITTLSGSIYESVTQIDLNLDGEFDDADKDVYYDFNFAVMCSHCSFSCGNMLPILAHTLGVMVMGETSGGGSCNVTERYLADGFAFPISDIVKNVLSDGTDYDLGAPIDVDLTVVDENGEIDYTGFYDLDDLAAKVTVFYGGDLPHVHTPGDPVVENELAATCEEGGSFDSVVYCTECGEEISRETVVIDPLGHNWGEWTVTKEATETEMGEEIRVCANDESHVETREIPTIAHQHQLTKVEAKPATESEAGNKEYYVCEGCGKWFEDAEGTKEIEDHDSMIIPQIHSYEPPQAGSAVEILIVLSIISALCAAVVIGKRKKYED